MPTSFLVMTVFSFLLLSGLWCLVGIDVFRPLAKLLSKIEPQIIVGTGYSRNSTKGDTSVPAFEGTLIRYLLPPHFKTSQSFFS